MDLPLVMCVKHTIKNLVHAKFQNNFLFFSRKTVIAVFCHLNSLQELGAQKAKFTSLWCLIEAFTLIYMSILK